MSLGEKFSVYGKHKKYIQIYNQNGVSFLRSCILNCIQLADKYVTFVIATVMKH
jgi:hypothetical protein